MTKRKRKDKLIAFRVNEDEAKSVDILAKLTGTNRSVILRRLVPDLTDVPDSYFPKIKVGIIDINGLNSFSKTDVARLKHLAGLG